MPRTTVRPSLRALVVDDREDVATGLMLLLKQMGHNVSVAYNAEGALAMAEATSPEVVFLDIGLPDSSGYEVCKELRQSEWGARSFIVAVTGHDEAADLIRAAHTGFDRHVVKPMAFQTLKEILATVEARHTFPNDMPPAG